MKTRQHVVETTHYVSEIHPEIWTQSERDGKVIAWADETPDAWPVVCTTRSKAWGKNSSHYTGSVCGSISPFNVLMRLCEFHHTVTRGVSLETPDKECSPEVVAGRDFFQWSAQFTLEHYGDKGFRGGFFQQHDGTYLRGCATLDYTPSTKKEVIERFRQWCETGANPFPTDAILIDGVLVWGAKSTKKEKAAR